jgi:Holliday junction resolvasome RuvABC endonuclease subunit
MTNERQTYIQNQLITFHNNHSLPKRIKELAMTIDKHLNYKTASFDMIEQQYQLLQVQLCDYILELD